MKKVIKFVWIMMLVVTIISISINWIVAAERPVRMTCTWPVWFDPAIGADMASAGALLNLYDPLVILDEYGEEMPHVAESWKLSDDALTWTFHIQKGIKFHDGSEVSASDVEFSFNRLKAIGRGFAYLFLRQDIKTELIDEYTINFILEKSIGPFVKFLAYVFIANEDLIRANIKETDEFGGLGDYGKEYLVTHDAGSGAYKIKKVEVGNSVTMELFQDYWLPLDPNVPDEVQFIGTTEAITVRTLLSQRELEIGDQNQSVENLKVLDEIEGIDIAAIPLANMWHIQIHTRKPPTDDIHVRKAMAWAFDYENIINNVLIGTEQAIGPVPRNIPGHDPTVFQYHRDLEKAMEELKQSKYYGQLDKYPVVLNWVAEVADEEKIALVFMSNMAEIGITVKTVKTPWVLYVDQISNIDTTPNIGMGYPACVYSEAGSMLEQRYISATASSQNQVEWLLDPIYDSMCEDAITTIDKEERFEKYHKMQHYIVDLCPTIYVSDYVVRHPFQSYYLDWWYPGKPICPLKGYNLMCINMRVYPEKRAELLK